MNEKRSVHSAHSLTHTYHVRTYTRKAEKARALSSPHTLHSAMQIKHAKRKFIWKLEFGLFVYLDVFFSLRLSLSLLRPIRTSVVASAFYLGFLLLFHFVIFIFSVAVAVSGAVLCLLLFLRLILASIIFMMKM